MTYGDVTGRMREHMIWLLERHRIQQRIGGGGSVSVPVTTTEAQRAQIGAEIMRYRDTVLVYCRQAIAAAAPVPKPIVDSRHPDPVETLRRRLDAAAPHRPTDATSLSEVLPSSRSSSSSPPGGTSPAPPSRANARWRCFAATRSPPSRRPWC
jgi:hypothetical protein